jgi:hypothetical protein
MSNKFIFVVCGAKEHIDTLHYSLHYLKKFSKNEIWVLTDSSRNEISIVHDNIIDIQTPHEFDHHQASIFLKTGIHHYFPKGNRYCYLDTDIIALSAQVDSIFNEYVSPITFAPDHCTMDQFSPYAMHCDCLNENKKYQDLLNAKLDELDSYRTSKEKNVIDARREWQSLYAKLNSRFSSRIAFGIKYKLSRGRVYLSSDLFCDRKKKVWVKGETIFMKQLKVNKVCKEVGLKWSYIQMQPITPNGKKLWGGIKCNHLQKAIAAKYQITPTIKFQHWNGGVFLFDDDSHAFLETWFQTTMETFKDPYWKTRDQGTLIKTIWQFGLQNHPTLNKKWNAIADYHNPYLSWIDDTTVQLNKDDVLQPQLLHVYHHFGDESWSFWNQIPKA